MSTWWNELSEQWRSLLLFNLHLDEESGFTDPRGILKVGVNPFANYELVHGRPFDVPVATAEDIDRLAELRFLYAAECDLQDIAPLASPSQCTSRRRREEYDCPSCPSRPGSALRPTPTRRSRTIGHRTGRERAPDPPWR